MAWRARPNTIVARVFFKRWPDSKPREPACLNYRIIAADGTPAYPYATGRQYYGTPSGGAVASISEAVTVHWQGGPNKQETPEPVTLSAANNDIEIVWSAVKGGTYQITAGDTPSTDQTVSTPTLSGSDKLSATLSFNNSTLSPGTAYPAILTFTPPGMTPRTVTSTNTNTR